MGPSTEPPVLLGEAVPLAGLLGLHIPHVSLICSRGHRFPIAWPGQDPSGQLGNNVIPEA